MSQTNKILCVIYVLTLIIIFIILSCLSYLDIYITEHNLIITFIQRFLFIHSHVIFYLMSFIKAQVRLYMSLYYITIVLKTVNLFLVDEYNLL